MVVFDVFEHVVDSDRTRGRLLTGFVLIGDGLGAGSAENDQIEQGVGSESEGRKHG